MNAVAGEVRKESLARYGVLGIFLLLVMGTAAFGASFSPDSWYASLNKPSWNPPNWIFGPVWTLLYLANAIAAWRVYLAGQSRLALMVWVVHLVPNAMWSMFFFGMHRVDLALINIILLLCTIVSTSVLFYQRDRIAGLLMMPYLAWVSFAAFLNWTLMSLNLDAF